MKVLISLLILFVSINLLAITIKAGPYVQYISEDKALISYETDVEAITTLKFRCNQDISIESVVQDAQKSIMHHFQIDRLDPSEGCTYSVGMTDNNGALVETPKFSFNFINQKRQPHFLFITDIHQSENMKTYTNVIKKLNPEFIVDGGDNVDTGGQQDLWYQYFSASKDYLTSYVLFPIIGNHEYRSGGVSNFKKYFGTMDGNLYYELNFPNVSLIFLNSSVVDEPADETSNQVSWLKDRLSKASSENKMKIVISHHALLSSGLSTITTPYSKAHSTFYNLVIDMGADLVLSGHEHVYEELTAAGSNGHQTKFITCSSITDNGNVLAAPFHNSHSNYVTKQNGLLDVIVYDKTITISLIDNTGKIVHAVQVNK